jgi:hypothetical protein
MIERRCWKEKLTKDKMFQPLSRPWLILLVIPTLAIEGKEWIDWVKHY